ncbi:hypothetical protein RKD52_003686 [Metabacillus sp. SLBN-84]
MELDNTKCGIARLDLWSYTPLTALKIRFETIKQSI